MSAPVYDKEAVYDAELSPLMEQIIAICKREAIPMLATFAYGQEPEDEGGRTNYCTTALGGPDGWQPDEIKEGVALIRNGASTRARVFAYTITTTRADSPEPQEKK